MCSWQLTQSEPPSPSLPPRPPACALPCQQEVPAEVPQHIFSEVLRLRCLGTAASNAKKEFGLTDRELRDMPHVEKSRRVWVCAWEGGDACMQD